MSKIYYLKKNGLQVLQKEYIAQAIIKVLNVHQTCYNEWITQKMGVKASNRRRILDLIQHITGKRPEFEDVFTDEKEQFT